MTDIISTVQKQDPGSELIHLYELEYATGSYARFFAGLDDDLTVVQFRDSSNTARDYTAIAIHAEGFDISSDGAYSRPEITVANMGSTFSSAVGGLDYQDLIGKRLTKITTFRKYLVGESGDSASAPGVSLPKVVYIIDRIKSKNIISVTFELASPFDLAGITLPRRVVVGGACSWRYKEGRKSLANASRNGGCSWEGVFDNTGTSTLYLNEKDEYIMNFTNSETTAFAAGSKTAGTIYRIAADSSVQRLAADGTKTANGGLQKYWQCLQNNSDSAPSEGVNYRRVHKYSAYSASTTYYGYTDSSYNDYVLKDSKLWRVRRTTQVAGASIAGSASNGTYTSQTADATSGSGTGMVITVQIVSGAVGTITITTAGQNYALYDTVTFNNFDGGTADLTVTVARIGTNGSVLEVGSHDEVTLGKFWIDGDLCGKTLDSCKKRFHATEDSTTYTNSVVSQTVNIRHQQLPFGGFPGVQQRR